MIFSWDPVSIMATTGIPLHSKCNLIQTPRVRVTNELATRGLPDLSLIESLSRPDNSLEIQSTSPTCNWTGVLNN
jgi:hypothetical protein